MKKFRGLAILAVALFLGCDDGGDTGTIADATLFDVGGRLDQAPPDDQGRPDAAPDRGRPDATPVDASPPDASPPDASPPDMAAPCQGDDSCGSGRWCNGGSCEDGCHIAPDDCGEGRRCDAASRDCVDCIADELCGDSIDNDCNGTADDGCDCVPDAACQTELAGPCAIGRVVCEGGAPRCVPEVSDEVCNGADDDCDGTEDEGIAGLGEACAAGVGACARQGVMACTEGGQVACSVVAGAPAGELCNGLDDDCDGSTDETFPDLGQACTVGRGVCERAGVRTCQDANTTRCDAVAAQPGAEACNTLDDDCDGRTDEGAVGQPLTRICYDGAPETENVSFCRAGQSTCENGQFGACEGQVLPAPEVCNGEDDDCDGRVDRTPDNQRLREACYTGPAGTSGVGVCVGGTAECQFGRLGACVGQVIPAAEICDQADNDCNGDQDDVAGGCACEPGQVRDCYPGPVGTNGRGLCRGGRQTCLADGSGFGACQGAVVPVAELCDGQDNDCDGSVDDAVAGVGQACTAGVGACAAQGVTSCNASEIVCDAVAGAPGAERCNAADDDCDGRTDEGFNLGRACEAGVGACAAQGINVCGPDGAVACNAVPAAPGAEVCNGGDDDCDGTPDEGLANLGACNSGRPGACAEGIRACRAGQERCEPAAPGEEVCNNQDDDCDLIVDEAQGDQNCGVGICARVLPICRNGAPVACDPLRGAVAEACNGLDDDCDGRTDEGLGLGLPCNDGQGVCSSPGVTICNVAGQAVCSGVAGQPRLEVCNLQDDDCDGTTDEDIEGVGVACGAGRGACRRDGQIQCAGGILGCSVVAGQPTQEVCDAEDDDCDGLTDERLGVGNGCAAGVGECRRNGLMVCAPDGAVVCNAVPAAPGAETCNGFDDDCNGVVDNNAQGAGVACSAGIGGCFREGTVVCAQARLSCNAVPGQPNAEVCDGIDNDCDRVVDDTPLDAGGACSEGVGACRANGAFACVNGALDCNAVPRQPSPEVCDNGDQDCDGRSDEGQPDCDANGFLDTCDIQFRRRADCNLNGIPDGCDIAAGLADCDNDGTPDVCADACVADVQPPLVNLFVGGNPINRGTQIQVVVQAQDNVGVVECRLFVGAQEVPLDGNCQAFVTFNQPGFFDVIGLASDAAGNEGRGEVRMRVLDPNDVEAPVIAIHSPPNASTIRQATPVIASVADPNLVEWVLYYGPQANPTQNVLARGGQNVNNQQIGVLDPGVIPRGDYGIVLRAEDINGRARSLIGVFTVGICEPVAEVCDFVDNDCDGRADENFGNIGGACTVGNGACQRPGVLRCLQGGGGSACDGQPGQPVAETCNATDDDCDTRTDEGFGAGVACQAGVGGCSRAGVTVCNAGGNGVVCNAQPGQPAAAEACNGIDDNCNGTTDEGFAPFVCGQGRCRQTLAFCPGQPDPVCDPFLGARPEVCDGIDDDCDGRVDEQASDAGGPCVTGLGACEREGSEVCVGGDLTCNVQPGQPAAEECNDEDDDCDGPVDENGICPDLDPPVVNIVLSVDVVNPGQQITITVIAQDPSGLVGLTVTADGVPLILDANGRTTYTPQVPGVVPIEVRVRDTAGNLTVETAYLRVRDAGDVTPPVVRLLAPLQNAVITEKVDIEGEIIDANFFRFVVEIARADTSNFLTLFEGNELPPNGVFGVLDATQIENGMYRLRLTGIDVNGVIVRDEVRVVIDGGAKVGLFTITYSDLTVPIAGMPLTVERTYDSRVKERRDFGVGWTLTVKQGKFEHNRPVSEGWTMLPGQFNLPCQRSSEDGIHTTELRVNDRERYAFRLVATPGAFFLGGCEVNLRYDFVYSNIPGRATLTILGGNQAYYLNGEPNLQVPDLGGVYEIGTVRLTTADGRIFDYSRQADGLYRVQDTNTNSISIQSDGLIHSAGESVDFVRDGQGRITQVVAPNGQRITYTYDARGDLVSVTDPLNQVTRYTYDARHNLIDIRDPSGNTPARQIYDEDGRLVAVQYPDGTRVELNHDPDNRVEVVADRLGHFEIFEYDEDGNILTHTNKGGAVTTNEYDAAGRLTRRVLPGNAVSTFAYDADGRMTRLTNPLGHFRTSVYNAKNQITRAVDFNGGVTLNEFDARGNLLRTTDPEGGVTSHTWSATGARLTMTDPEGNVTRWTYDARGRVATITDALNQVTTFTYDENGNRLTETKQRNGVAVTTRFFYDAHDKLIRTVNPLGHEVRSEYDVRSRKIAEIDSRGFRTEFVYDELGNNTAVRFPDGTMTRYVYDAENRRIREIDRLGRVRTIRYDANGKAIETGLPDGGLIGAAWDGRGNLVRETDERGNELAHEYDVADRRIRTIDEFGRITTYQYDPQGNRIGLTGPDGEVTTYEFDGMNRQTAIVYPDGTRMDTAYDLNGRKIAETDANGLTTEWAYDALGRLVEVTDPMGGVTTYTYDSLGNRITETDANGRTTRYEHDLLGRPIRKTLPGGEVMSAEFDPMGNMVRRVDYNGQVSTYAYDSNGKLTTINLPGGVVERATWTATGKRSTVTDARGVTRWTYDSMDRVSGRLDPNGEEVRWEYDASGNRTVVVTPVGTTRYAYDALNRLTTVTDPDGGVTRYTYHVTGTRASLTQANGLVTTYAYDENRRLVGMETHDGPVLVAGYRYTLDAGGRRIALEELHTDTTIDWVYDDLSRLVSETWNDGRVITYTYDTVGNRLTRNDSVDGATAYVYDANDRLVTAGDLAYEYDANGNPTTIGDSTYVYDSRDRLVQVESAEETVTYEYDVDGHRIGRVIDRGGALDETRYLVDENRRYTEVFAELDGAGNVNVRYVYGADLLSQHRGNDARYYVQDGQMSVRHLADGAGTITDSYDYDAFGNVLFQEGETPNDLLYNSQFFDPNSGFYYLRARWLDPETGRFLTVDPAEGLLHDPRTLHRYTYALNSPIDHADPSGRFTMVSISISLTINSSLQSIYTTNLVRFFLKATRIAICQLAPAYAAQNAAMEGIMNDTPGSYQLYEASRMMIAEGFRAIGGAIVETYQNIVNELIDFKFEINVDLNAAIDALQEQLGPGFGGFNEGVDDVQGILDAIEQLEKWKEKINEYIDTAKDWYNTVAAIIDDTATACDKAKAWEKVGNKLLDFVPSF